MEKKKKYERPLIKPINATMPGKSGTDAYISPMLDIDGVSVQSLAERFGTPLFVISEKQLRRNIRMAKRAFSTRLPKVVFAWSYKTNYLDAVCRAFHQEGSWAEVVSGFEYDKALSNGVPGEHIVFNGPSKKREDLEKALKNASLIHIDNLDELYMLVELAGELQCRPQVAVRVNLNAGILPVWDRFGFNLENGQALDAVSKIMSFGCMDLRGLHCHIGTFILSSKAYGVAARKLADFACDIRRLFGVAVEYIDMGGGFASKNTLKASYLVGADICPSMDDYAEEIADAFHKAPFGKGEFPALLLETGRALVDDAGFLLASVLTNKRSAQGGRYTVMDAGVNLLFTSFWYNHKISPAQLYSQHFENTTLYGPLCMNIDVVREQVSLPLLNKGDLLVVHNVGAYNMTQWMQFITLRPNIVMIEENGGTKLIREAENFDDVTRLERL